MTQLDLQFFIEKRELSMARNFGGKITLCCAYFLGFNYRAPCYTAGWKTGHNRQHRPAASF
jgi:hypothetical protein